MKTCAFENTNKISGKFGQENSREYAKKAVYEVKVVYISIDSAETKIITKEYNE